MYDHGALRELDLYSIITPSTDISRTKMRGKKIQILYEMNADQNNVICIRRNNTSAGQIPLSSRKNSLANSLMQGFNITEIVRRIMPPLRL